jgi:hypothetical protein
MRIAWFAPEPSDVALQLGHPDLVDHFDEHRAHQFVWRHHRTPYDITVFDLADRGAHAFLWPYLFHYPGIVLLRSGSLHHSRSTRLTAEHRYPDWRAERAFSGPTFLRAPLAASRLVAVHDPSFARDLQEELPDVPVRVVPAAAAPAALAPFDGRFRFHASSRHEIVSRAAGRLRRAGCPVIVADPADGLRQHDVAIALEWPPPRSLPVKALRAMAAGLPVIVFETEAAAAMPTLDPQTWQSRGYQDRNAPVAISIDPRDEEHSLMLAMRRLASDASLRSSLGAAAAAWARTHARPDVAASAWRAVLHEAAARDPVTRQSDLPAHLRADGTERARALLREIGVTVDFL